MVRVIEQTLELQEVKEKLFCHCATRQIQCHLIPIAIATDQFVQTPFETTRKCNTMMIGGDFSSAHHFKNLVNVYHC